MEVGFDQECPACMGYGIIDNANHLCGLCEGFGRVPMRRSDK